MKFGYLLVVSSNDSANYLRMAYTLAMSIKHTQKPGFDQVALVIDDASLINEVESSWVFDHVIEWNQETFWDGRSWMDKLSPFDATICLDVDMLFLRDCSHWVEYFLENCDLYIPSKSYNYRGEVADDDFYRKTFRENNLPNLYSFYTFFKKDSETVKEFFTLGRYILKNPIEFSNQHLTKFKPKIIGTDEAFALSAKLLGIEDDISYSLDFPRVVHMKPMVQGWPWPSDKVTDHVGFYLNRKYQLKIGNFQQTDIIHYVEKDKADLEMVSILEKMIWKN
jgi:hypothetical protein